MCTKLRRMDISIKWFNFSQTWKENLIQLTQHVTPGLQAWDAMHRRGATSEARSERTGCATHPLLHQDTLCCTPPEQERSAASRHWLLLHPSINRTASALHNQVVPSESNHLNPTCHSEQHLELTCLLDGLLLLLVSKSMFVALWCFNFLVTHVNF